MHEHWIEEKLVCAWSKLWPMLMGETLHNSKNQPPHLRSLEGRNQPLMILHRLDANLSKYKVLHSFNVLNLL